MRARIVDFAYQRRRTVVTRKQITINIIDAVVSGLVIMAVTILVLSVLYLIFG